MSLLQDLLSLNVPPSLALAVTEQDDSGEKPGIMAKADEFTVHVEDEMVHLEDGEGTVRVSMPRDVWMDLCKQSCKSEE